MIRFLTWLGLVRGITLLGNNGCRYNTIMRGDEWGRWAHIYPFVRVGSVTLNDDGTTGGEACYIVRWRPMPSLLDRSKGGAR